MTKEKRITCIVCPIGCKILVESRGKLIENLDGNKCVKGIEYAKNEALDPRRMLTTSVLVKDGEWPLVSVKSSQPVPKDRVFKILNEIKKVKLNAPVKAGEEIIKSVANTDFNIIATKTVKKIMR